MLYRVEAALALVSIPLVLSTALYLVAFTVLLFLVPFVCKKRNRTSTVHLAEDRHLIGPLAHPDKDHTQSFKETKRSKPLAQPRKTGRDTFEFRITEFNYFEIRDQFEKMSLTEGGEVDCGMRFPSPPPPLPREEAEQEMNNFKTIESCGLEKSGKLKG